MVLHEVLDKPLFQERQRSGQRYADNIVLACTSLTEGRDVHEEARQLLDGAGLTFKGGDAHAMVDLTQGGHVHLLGLNIRKGDRALIFRTDETAWDDLDMHIQDCHTWDDPPETARTVVRSWVSSQGPALANWGDADLDRILTIGNTHGFREIISRESYQTTRWTAMDRWDQLRRTAHTGG